MIFQGTLHTESIEDTARNTKKFRFSVSTLETLEGKNITSSEFNFQAGQFLSLQFTDTAWRAYSIASAPSEKYIEFIVRFVPEGTASDVWWRTKIGDVFPFKGPFGEFKLSENSNSELVFCGTGTGIAPLRSMILTENQSPNPRPMTLFYGGRDKEDIAYIEEIPQWSAQLQTHLGFSQNIPSDHIQDIPCENCRITKFLQEFPKKENVEFYVCGNGDMVKSVIELLQKEKNIAPEKIFFERFN